MAGMAREHRFRASDFKPVASVKIVKNLFGFTYYLCILIIMIANQNSIRFDWAESVHLLRARWTSVLLIVSIVLMAGAVILVGFPQKHCAAVTLVFFENESAVDPVALRRSSEMQASSRNHLKREMVELKSRDLLGDVVKKADLVSRWRMSSPSAIEKLEESIGVVRGPEPSTLVVSVIDSSSEGAADLANILAERFVSKKTSAAVVEANRLASRLAEETDVKRNETIELENTLMEMNRGPAAGTEAVDEVRRELLIANNLLLALEARHQAAVIDASRNQKVVSITVPASSSTATSLGNPWTTAGSLAALGLVIGVGVVGFFSMEKGRIEVVLKTGEALDVSVVGLVPVTGKSLMDRVRPSAKLIEPFRDLRTKIDRLPAGDCLFFTLVPERDAEGFAEILVNLAAVHADAGHTVLVIDADMREPRLHEHFDSAQHPGLSDFLKGEMRVEETVIKTRRDNLWFMPSGPAPEDPSGLIAGRRMTDLVWEMRSRFDYIIVSSPNVLEYAEAGALVEFADHTIAVSPYRSHSVSKLKKAKATVELASGVFSGVIFSQSPKIEKPIEPVVQIKPAPALRAPDSSADLEESKAGPALTLEEPEPEPDESADLDALQSTLAPRLKELEKSEDLEGLQSTLGPRLKELEKSADLEELQSTLGSKLEEPDDAFDLDALQSALTPALKESEDSVDLDALQSNLASRIRRARKRDL